MPVDRDSRGRFTRGCTYSREPKTRKCRSKVAHARRQRRAVQTIGSRVAALRARQKRANAMGVYDSYDAFHS
jgi:hypothetical protein